MKMMKNELLAQCTWPKLSEKYDIALREAVEFILENYSVSGIVAAGSIIRGNPDPASDLDIYVIQETSFRQRLQKNFNGVPAEIFINPPKAVEEYLEEEKAHRRPITAHMLATGFVVLNLDPVIEELRKKANTMLSNPPAAPKDLRYQRYLAALLYEDAVDIVEKDRETAEMIVHKAVAEMLNFIFIETGSFIPRQKSLLTELAKTKPRIAELARSFFKASALDLKMEIAGKIADQTIKERCFFEWDSSPEEVS